MVKPTSGEIYLEGKKIENLDKNEMADIRMRKIGFVFQHYYLNPKLTVTDNIVLALKANPQIRKDEYYDITDGLLKQFSIEGYKNQYPDRMSGGEQQRVCIARALANNPDIIMADEPTGNLDEDNEKVVLEYLKKLTEMGKTVIMVSHSNEVKKYADNILYMKNGKLREKKEEAVF